MPILLAGSVFVVAASGLVYELAAGAVASYLLGDAVTRFSLVVGTFLSAMGPGAWLARFVRGDLVRVFVDVEIALGLVGGSSSIAMFAASALLEPWFVPIFHALVVAIGTLVGLEIPLVVRIVREGGAGFGEAVSDVLALDYLGALAGSLAFPLLALPLLGLSRTSVVFGLLNLGVAALALTLLERRRGPAMRLAVATVALTLLLAGSSRLCRLPRGPALPGPDRVRGVDALPADRAHPVLERGRGALPRGARRPRPRGDAGAPGACWSSAEGTGSRCGRS